MPENATTAPASCCCAATPNPSVMPPPVSGRFDLVDHFGRVVSERSFGDRYLLVFFGFSNCAVVCPRELTKLTEALRLLGPLAGRVQPLYISVDPGRDSPDVLQKYLSRYERGGVGFLGLTGTEAQVDAARKSFRVFAARVDDAASPAGYALAHTAIAFLMGPGGAYGTHCAESLDATAVAARLKHHLERNLDVAA